MRTITTRTHIAADGHLRLDVPTDLPSGDVELVVVIQPATDADARKYDFRDLAGSLKWAGDATAEQRNLRNEW